LLLGQLRYLRQRLSEITRAPAQFSWHLRVDPQIEGSYGSANWALTRFRGELNALMSEGDELGIHPHMWRWHEGRGAWFNDYEDEDWVERCIQVSVDAFSEAFGRPPRLVRFGDHWLAQRALVLASSLGLEYDLTIERGTRGRGPSWGDRGRMPDYRVVPAVPYRPSALSFLAQSDQEMLPIWLVPAQTYVSGLRAVLDRLRPGRFARPLNLALEPSFFCQAIRRELMRPEARVTVVVGRTGDLSRSEQRRNFESNLEILVSCENLSGFVFATPREAVQRYLEAVADDREREMSSTIGAV
jgi:hypothetical protein